MPTSVITAATRVQCAHGAFAMCPMPAQKWVTIDGEAVLTVADEHTVAGCTNGGGQAPCFSIRWSSGSSRLSIDGKAVLTGASVGRCFGAAGDAGSAKIDPFSLQTWVLDE